MDIKLTDLEKELLRIFVQFMKSRSHPTTKGIYIVGGFVRDKLLQKNPSDMDIIVYQTLFRDFIQFLETDGKNKGIIPFKSCFINQKNKQLLTYLFKKTIVIEISPYEGKLSEEAYRRDFTVNALMLDIYSSNLLSFYDGDKDMKTMVIKLISNYQETFKDDFSRFYRMMNLVGKGFQIDEFLRKKTIDYFRTVAYKKLPEFCIRRIDRFFKEGTSKIIEQLIDLGMMKSVIHLDQSDYKINVELIYKKILILVQKVEIFQKMPVHSKFILQCKFKRLKFDWKPEEIIENMKKACFPFMILHQSFTKKTKIKEEEFNFTIPEIKNRDLISFFAKSESLYRFAQHPNKLVENFLWNFEEYPLIGLLKILNIYPLEDINIQLSSVFEAYLQEDNLNRFQDISDLIQELNFKN